MKYLKLFESLADALDTRLQTPQVCIIRNNEKTCFASNEKFGDHVLIVKDGDDFIKGYEYTSAEKDIICYTINTETSSVSKISSNFKNGTFFINSSENTTKLILIKKSIMDNLINVNSSWTASSTQFYKGRSYEADSVKYNSLEEAIANFKVSLFVYDSYGTTDHSTMPDINICNFYLVSSLGDDSINILKSTYNIDLNLYKDGYYITMMVENEYDYTYTFNNGIIYIGESAPDGYIPEDLTSDLGTVDNYTIKYFTSNEEIYGGFDFIDTMIDGDVYRKMYNITNHSYNEYGEIRFDSEITTIGMEDIPGTYNSSTDEYSKYIYPYFGQYSEDYCLITAIKLPDSITTINDTLNGIYLSSITLPNQLLTLEYSLNDCPSLTSVIIPNTITTINSCFANCALLNNITYNGTINEWLSITNLGMDWRSFSNNLTINCTDGNIVYSTSGGTTVNQN